MHDEHVNINYDTWMARMSRGFKSEVLVEVAEEEPDLACLPQAILAQTRQQDKSHFQVLLGVVLPHLPVGKKFVRF